MADEHPPSFWKFVEAWAPPNASSPPLGGSAPPACGAAIAAAAAALLPPALSGLLDLGLALRAYAPRLELWRQVAGHAGVPVGDAHAPCCHASLDGRLLADSEELRAALAAPPPPAAATSAPPALLGIDHVYPREEGGGGAATRTAVLYGAAWGRGGGGDRSTSDMTPPAPPTQQRLEGFPPPLTGDGASVLQPHLPTRHFSAFSSAPTPSLDASRGPTGCSDGAGLCQAAAWLAATPELCLNPPRVLHVPLSSVPS